MTAWCVALTACSDDGVAGDGTDGGTANTSPTVGDDGDDGADDGGTSSVDGDSTAGDDGSTGAGTADDADETGAPVGVECINAPFLNGPSPGLDYSEFDITIGSHCQGTNHQDITGVERVVFLGDSVTVGTPPTQGADSYRAILAAELATAFAIEAPSAQWNNFNIINGEPIEQESGAFAQCSEWGGRNDDLIPQLESCFGEDNFDLTTLVVMTSGGNDISRMTTDAIEGVPAKQLFDDLEAMVDHHRQAIDWLVGDPAKFPNGVFVVNANVFEFTDYTADVLSCPTAAIAGYSDNPPNTDVLLGALNLINEEYLQVAIDTGTDVAFMFETMCGHGFHAGNADNVCYRGPDAQNWFDATCIHPTPTGHASVADMFLNVITE
ncbi:MAG: SGNH/GDSL hydrolase family protein [Myxococcota bacterium]